MLKRKTSSPSVSLCGLRLLLLWYSLTRCTGNIESLLFLKVSPLYFLKTLRFAWEFYLLDQILGLLYVNSSCSKKSDSVHFLRSVMKVLFFFSSLEESLFSLYSHAQTIFPGFSFKSKKTNKQTKKKPLEICRAFA